MKFLGTLGALRITPPPVGSLEYQALYGVHDYAQGDRVSVPYQGGNVDARGPATIVAVYTENHTYLVAFDACRGSTYERVIRISRAA